MKYFALSMPSICATTKMEKVWNLYFRFYAAVYCIEKMFLQHKWKDILAPHKTLENVSLFIYVDVLYRLLLQE